ncbi:spermidine/putrescine ABC transporter substrate-binding protein [Hahella sp. HN01]|uniref:polyamine ABC transporter substrate-binding protein n=1 Tax=Hahella sp. HN01 TaxID=2847262 RepID=UPI001C1EBA6D|nr:spermidine/putrescine ABC transporter substrate-binding protein [Hahella sp. HN01]MBU6951070.1 spermidine/putrescine ABC transporter substrate-binding protein [Hahella sp. HN01]
MRLFTPLLRGGLALTLCLVLSGIAASATAVAEDTLVILTWEDYMAPEVIEAFEAKYNVKVRQVYYEDDDERDLIMANTGGAGFDLLVFDELMREPYHAKGWLETFRKSDLPNLRYVRYPLKKQDLPQELQTVPYAWGSVGIIYRKDLAPRPPTSWMDLFRPVEALKGKILVINTATTAFSMALKSLGYSVNSIDENELNAAAELLRKQRPYVRAYRNPLAGEGADLFSGEVWMAMAYNGDALNLMHRNANIDFVYPMEGSGLWLDSIAVLTKSNSKDLALQFINFIHDPEINARNTKSIFFATANIGAEQRLPKSFLNNPVIYPSAKSLARFEQLERLPASTMRRVIADFVTITSQ